MKPTIVKIRQGTDRADRINKNEPAYEPLHNPQCLNELDEEGRKEWDKIYPLLMGNGLATEADERLLVEWCRIISKLKYLNDKITNETMVVKKNQTAGLNFVINPYIKLYELYFNKMILLSAKFGLSPADRTRIGMPSPINKKGLQNEFIKKAI